MQGNHKTQIRSQSQNIFISFKSNAYFICKDSTLQCQPDHEQTNKLKATHNLRGSENVSGDEIITRGDQSSIHTSIHSRTKSVDCVGAISLHRPLKV